MEKEGDLEMGEGRRLREERRRLLEREVGRKFTQGIEKI